MKIACAFLFVAAAIVAVQAGGSETEKACEDYPPQRCRSENFREKCPDYCEAVAEARCKDKRLCKKLAKLDEEELAEECTSAEVAEDCPVTCGECEPPMPRKVKRALAQMKKTCKKCVKCLKTEDRPECENKCKRCKRCKKALKEAIEETM